VESAGKKNSLTPSQRRAVDARGNVLVMAGAGTGKTHTLVERCLDLVGREGASLDEILVVTFTEAAAAEMRQRLRRALEKAEPADAAAARHIAQQLALFDTAHIGTLHSFCFKLVREHFHHPALALDPRLSILDEGQAKWLAEETLDEQFDAHYAGEDEFSVAVQDLIRIYGSGRDEKIRALVLRLHRYAQTRPDADAWMRQQITEFASVEPARWRTWLDEAITDWCREWTPLLEQHRGGIVKAGECLELLKRFKSPELFVQLQAADADWPRGTKKFREPIEDFFEEAKFLGSLAGPKNDPLAEDWNWVRGHMQALVRLAGEFADRFAARKRADGVLDFHDLEQFTLKLLWEPESGRPTEIARRWREKLRFVFVDEYQDINAAQDRIIAALSRDGADANRFLVGDVKQSIYRFRLAAPAIFRGYAREWKDKKGQTIPLLENFRSRAGLLDLVNSLFTPLMHEAVGGVEYDDDAKLRFGGTAARDEAPGPRAELLLRVTENRRGEAPAADDGLADLEEAAREARMLALRLRELKETGHEVREGAAARPVEWRDMAVLLRAPSGKAEIFAKQFEQAGVPLLVERGGFYESAEIADLLCLLQLLDNPLQDVPLIAVLRSPLVGCSLDELASIRLAGGKQFWFALNRAAAKDGPGPGPVRAKAEHFLERFARWRRAARQISLSQCLERILDETYYADWLKSRPGGLRRHANVTRLLHLTQRFDRYQRQGLFRFLRFVEAQRELEVEPEVAPMTSENAVRLMSIHQSKGLEFPVVAVADLGKPFNTQDLYDQIILDERFGLCPRVKPPDAGGRYPSLPWWRAQKHQRRELAGEELRLLYVALTRARDTLVLTGNVSRKKWETVFNGTGAVTEREVLAARSYADWLALWFRAETAAKRDELLRWRTVEDGELAPDKAESEGRRTAETVSPSLDAAAKLQTTLTWQYPFDAATKRAAKSSVTVLRREANEATDEAEPILRSGGKRAAAVPGRLTAADAGLAYHKFLQHFDLATAADAAALRKEADRLQAQKVLSADERDVLDLKNIGAFWESATGRQIRGQAEAVRRELPFTARFRLDELDQVLGTKNGAGVEDEFVVVQGVADLVVLLPGEIWLVDFKTDDFPASAVAEKVKLYAPQLKLYARALKKIYRRPVTNGWLHFLSQQRTEKI